MPADEGRGPLSILVLCSHNRTRSVIIRALLHLHLSELGVDADIATAGFHDDGMPPTAPTVTLLAERGIDVGGHSSRRVTGGDVERADLVVVAERDHVVRIAADHDGFAKTFTLPELVREAELTTPLQGAPIGPWLERINARRPAGRAYLASAVPEIADPTGHTRPTWEATIAEIDDLTARLARTLA